MTLNKLALVLGFGMSVVAGAASAADPVPPVPPVPDQGHGTVKFTGSIIDSPCSITPDTENQTVPLGQISLTALHNGGRSNSRDFKIKLENCTLATATTVQTTFTGSEYTDIPGSLGIEGIAKNAAVVITDAGGKQIKLGTPSAKQALRNGDNVLNFAAYLQGSGTNIVVPGDFTAIATFALTYQ